MARGRAGEIKPIDSYEKGLYQLSGRDAAGNDMIVTYDDKGNLWGQVFGENEAGERVIIKEGSLGQVAQLPLSPPGTTKFGQEMEPLVLDKIEQQTGWTLERHPAGATGPDIVPIR